MAAVHGTRILLLLPHWPYVQQRGDIIRELWMWIRQVVLDVWIPVWEQVLLLLPGRSLQSQLGHKRILVNSVSELPGRQVPELVWLFVLLFMPCRVLSTEHSAQWLRCMPQGQVRRRRGLHNMQELPEWAHNNICSCHIERVMPANVRTGSVLHRVLVPQLPDWSVPELCSPWIPHVQELPWWILPILDQILHLWDLPSRNILNGRRRQLLNVPFGNVSAIHRPHVVLLLSSGSLPVQQRL